MTPAEFASACTEDIRALMNNPLPFNREANLTADERDWSALTYDEKRARLSAMPPGEVINVALELMEILEDEQMAARRGK